MSVSTLFSKNSFNINCKSLNGITQNEITGANSNGQVLTIVDKDNKIVGWADQGGSNLPDTSEYPNGYVLKILDNLENTYTWAQDTTGGTVPLFLTGDSTNALKVQTTGMEPILKVDTIDKEVHLSGIRNIIDGDDNIEKFLVKDSTGNNVLWVDTISDSVYISGNDTSGAKLGIQNALGDFIFVVDTNNDLLRMGNGSVNPSEIDLKPTNGFVEVSGKTGGVLKTAFKCNHIVNPNGGSVEMSAYRDNTDYNKIESNGAQGFEISSNNNLRIIGTSILIDSASGLTLEGNVFIPASSYLDVIEVPTIATRVTNKGYVDDRVGGLSSGIQPSAQALGNIITPQSLNPLAFLPNTPSIPSNYLKSGQSYQLVMSGDAQFSNGNNFTITLVASNNGSPVTLGSVNIIVPNVSGTQTWELEGDFTIRSIVGNLATIFCSFDFTYNDNQSFIGKRALSFSNSLNITFPQSLNVNVTFTSGGALDNISTQLYILKKIVDV